MRACTSSGGTAWSDRRRAAGSDGEAVEPAAVEAATVVATTVVAAAVVPGVVVPGVVAALVIGAALVVPALVGGPLVLRLAGVVPLLVALLLAGGEALVVPGPVAAVPVVAEARGEQRVEDQCAADAPGARDQRRLPPRLGVPAGRHRPPGHLAARVVVRRARAGVRRRPVRLATDLHLAVLPDGTRVALAGQRRQR